MNEFYTVKDEKVIEIEVEKSKFIGILIPFFNKDNLKNEIEKIKNRFPKARHYCYAFVLDNEFKYSDDGEPSGTAGKPIYQALEAAKLKNVLLIVVRYFGGTLLGSGRLLRTYLKCASEVIREAKLYRLVPKMKYRVRIDCSNYQSFVSYLNKMHFITLNKSFNDTITLDFLTDLDFKQDLESIFYGKLEIIGKIEYMYMEEIG